MNLPEAPFSAPWQARAFALTVHLHDSGVFSWSDWAATLGAAIAQDGGDYWAAWLRALETIVQAKGVASREEAAAMAQLWQEAARATPHGTPIALGEIEREEG